MTPDLARQMGAWRHSLHRKPELGFQERGTAAFITAQLEALGFIVHGGIGGTGLVASLRSGDGAGVIGLRADMDALAMTETGTSAHASEHPGRMHGCGHDGHMAMVLGAAALLTARRVVATHSSQSSCHHVPHSRPARMRRHIRRPTLAQRTAVPLMLC